MDSGNIWPEQEAVLAWLRKHGVDASHEAIHELMEAATAYRLEVQAERNSLLKQLESVKNLCLCEDYPGKRKDLERALGVGGYEAQNEESGS